MRKVLTYRVISLQNSSTLFTTQPKQRVFTKIVCGLVAIGGKPTFVKLYWTQGHEIGLLSRDMTLIVMQVRNYNFKLMCYKQ